MWQKYLTTVESVPRSVFVPHSITANSLILQIGQSGHRLPGKSARVASNGEDRSYRAVHLEAAVQMENTVLVRLRRSSSRTTVWSSTVRSPNPWTVQWDVRGPAALGPSHAKPAHRCVISATLWNDSRLLSVSSTCGCARSGRVRRAGRKGEGCARSSRCSARSELFVAPGSRPIIFRSML